MCPGWRPPIAGWVIKAAVLMIISAGLVMAAPQTAHACSCAQASTQEQFDSADVVVEGAVNGPDAVGPNFLAYVGIVPTVIYTVQVTGMFKGEAAGQVVQVVTSASGASCGWESIKKGGKYIVFATNPDNGGSQLEANLCGGTRPVSDGATAELIGIAGEPSPPDKSIPKPNDPDQSVLLFGLLAITLLLGAGVWLRRRRQSVM